MLSPFAIKTQQQQGFSLLEVLISIVILSIGLLGVAGLQLTGLRFSHDANLLYTASQQADDILDRMRANRAGIAAGAYDTLTGGGTDPGCISTGCTATQMANTDAFEWGTLLAQALPMGTGTITGNGTGSLFTITVTWTEISPSGGSRNMSYELQTRI
jgi:type IV pilus assembly protein PilV